ERALRSQRGEDGVAGEERSRDRPERVGDREAPDARGDVGARGDPREQEREGRSHPERGEREDRERGEGAAELAALPGRDVLACEREDARELVPERDRDREREGREGEAAGERV